MDANRVLAESARGIHLLFENATIAAAFAQDPVRLRRAVLREGPRLRQVIDDLLHQPTATEGRRFVAELAPELRYLIVVLYFELLDDWLKRSRVLH
jgi:hypothetical protein